jgi:hypothetical protein
MNLASALRSLPALGLLTFGAGLRAQYPEMTASAALAAWARADGAALEALAHPELKRRCRDARIIREYLARYHPPQSKLLALAERKPPADEPDPLPILEYSAPDAATFKLLGQALAKLAPRNRKLAYYDRWTDTFVAGDLAILTYVSGWRDPVDPIDRGSWPTEVILKKSGGAWRFLWSNAVQDHVDPRWDPRRELADVTLVSDGATVVEIKDVKRYRRISPEVRLKLPPGLYQVTGTREGYVDVNWMLRIHPDLQPARMTVVCTTRVR